MTHIQSPNMNATEFAALVKERMDAVCVALSLSREELQAKMPHLTEDHLASFNIVTDSEMKVDNVASYIDHTLLKPMAQPADITAITNEAKEYEFASVCVNGCYATQVHEELSGSPVKTCCVIGFPLGAMNSDTKHFEARQLIMAGADEIDMVVNMGMIHSGDLLGAYNDICAVVSACHSYAKKALLKVILECGANEPKHTIDGCILSYLAGADFVKTSTGFGYGGAKIEDVAMMRAVVGPSVGVKASGGVRCYKDAVNVIANGATRIGASAGVAIVKGKVATSDY